MTEQVGRIEVEITVLLGRCTLPMHQLLRMGRGTMIPLDTGENDELWILANNHPIARGEVMVQSEKVAVQVTGPADVNDYYATLGIKT